MFDNEKTPEMPIHMTQALQEEMMAAAEMARIEEGRLPHPTNWITGYRRKRDPGPYILAGFVIAVTAGIIAIVSMVPA